MSGDTQHETAPMPLDGPLMASVSGTAAVAVLLALGAAALYGWKAAVGVATGGLVATLNLWIFAIILKNVLAGSKKAKWWGVAGAIKFIALLIGVYFILRAGIADGLTLAVGYGSLPIGIVVGMLLGPKPGDDDPLPDAMTSDGFADAGSDRPEELVRGARNASDD